MATQKQIDANRENAKKSTGPTTEEGKARSSMNGFKSHLTGLTTIMADEDSDARAEFVVKLIDAWAPKGPIERQLATTIALDNWRLNRIKTVEENIFAFDLILPDKVYNHERIEVENAIGHVLTYVKRSREIDRISLYESRLNKNHREEHGLTRKASGRPQSRREEGRQTHRSAPKDSTLYGHNWLCPREFATSRRTSPRHPASGPESRLKSFKI